MPEVFLKKNDLNRLAKKNHDLKKSLSVKSSKIKTGYVKNVKNTYFSIKKYRLHLISFSGHF